MDTGGSTESERGPTGRTRSARPAIARVVEAADGLRDVGTREPAPMPTSGSRHRRGSGGPAETARRRLGATTTSARPRSRAKFTLRSKAYPDHLFGRAAVGSAFRRRPRTRTWRCQGQLRRQTCRCRSQGCGRQAQGGDQDRKCERVGGPLGRGLRAVDHRASIDCAAEGGASAVAVAVGDSGAGANTCSHPSGRPSASPEAEAVSNGSTGGSPSVPGWRTSLSPSMITASRVTSIPVVGAEAG